MPTPAARTLSPAVARRLAIASQKLAERLPPPDSRRMLDVVRQLGCLQLDPISAVARSHQLVLFSRLGPYKLSDLDTLMWDERLLFEYWAHAASIVLTEDFPIHSALMRGYLNPPKSAWAQRAKEWLGENETLRQYVLDELRQRGPMLSREFEDMAKTAWQSDGWTSGRNINQMLDYLWTLGIVVVSGRKGGQKVWDLSERFFPDWTPRDVLPDDERVSLATQKALRALGVGTVKHINDHYTRGRYPNLDNVLAKLEANGTVQRVQICDADGARAGEWYVHADNLPTLERIEAGDWHARTTLLSPFDNLICDRDRTERMFNFRFRIEIYVPKAKREFGYYVLPILHGDKLIGRIDPNMNRKLKTLEVNAVYAEPDAPQDLNTGREVAGAIESLAQFLGAKSITYTARVPEGWAKVLN